MRLVSLGPSLTEIIEGLGSHSELVGVTEHCLPGLKMRSSALPRLVGSPKVLELSEIDALAPDWIFADQNENRPEQIREIQKRHKILCVDVRSIQGVIDAIHSMARILKRSQEAEAITKSIRSALICEPPVTPGEGVPTLILLWRSPYVSVNFDTYASRLVESAGGSNVFRSEPIREFPVELEDMIDKNPELLLLPTDPFPFKKSHVADFQKFRVFSKIRIELMDGRFFSRYGPTTASAIKTLRALMTGKTVSHA